MFATTTNSTFDKINSGLDTTSRVLQLAPAILAFIQALNEIFPHPKSGNVKKAALIATVSNESIPVQQAVSRMADDVVAAANNSTTNVINVK